MLRRSIAIAPLLLLLLLAASASSPAAIADDDAETSSLRLELKIKMTLLDKLGVDGLRVETDATSGGRVVLAGEVKKRETRELAADVAKSVEGVREVVNEIRVEGQDDQPEKVGAAVAEAEREVKDAGLELRVRLALVDQMGRDGFRIGTDAAGATVSVEFPAGFDPERRKQAIEIAKQVAGVERVVDLEKK